MVQTTVHNSFSRINRLFDPLINRLFDPWKHSQMKFQNAHSTKITISKSYATNSKSKSHDRPVLKRISHIFSHSNSYICNKDRNYQCTNPSFHLQIRNYLVIDCMQNNNLQLPSNTEFLLVLEHTKIRHCVGHQLFFTHPKLKEVK